MIFGFVAVIGVLCFFIYWQRKEMNVSREMFSRMSFEAVDRLKERSEEEIRERSRSLEDVVKPVQESLKALDRDMRELEKERKGEQESLKAQIRSMMDSEKDLRNETASLSRALRAPMVRGKWGELQLKRVVELAGMLNHCDFYEQGNREGARPDMVVKMPGGKQIIIDAKTPCIAYLDAMSEEDEGRRSALLKEHASHVRMHINTLGKKAYWEKFQPSPEFVVLFIPSDAFYSAALEQDPSLVEVGVEEGVIIATPSTLIGLLRAIAYGWKQEKLSLHAKEVSALGHELYKRIIDMGDHWTRMGKSLSSAMESYNKAIGNLESRVLVTARKFKDLGVSKGDAEIAAPAPIEKITRQIQAHDMSEVD